MNAGRGIAIQHEYIIWRSMQESPIYLRNESMLSMLKAAEDIINKHKGVTPEAQKEYAAWINNNEELTGGEKAYRYIDEKRQVYQSVSLRAPEPRTDPKFFIPLKHPITGKDCPVPPNGFSRTPETLQTMIRQGEIIFGPDDSTQPRQKVILTEQKKRQISSVIQNGHKGKADLDRLGFDFPYCHPVSLYEELIASVHYSPMFIVFDYFAGSGTTGHAVLNLNRVDGGNRRFILAEVGKYFDSVLLPRIKKIIFTPEWKKGKPQRMATEDETERGPRIIKYIRLESYEDALNNIEFDERAGQATLKFDDYMLSYFLKWETKDCATLLNIEKLACPFSYKLKINNGMETNEKIVDIAETFSYLLGMHIKNKRVYKNGVCRYVVYRGLANHREVVVIWRETKGWEKKDYEQDKKFVAEQKISEGADEIFVNGDSLIPGSKSLDGMFKARMFAGA